MELRIKLTTSPNGTQSIIDYMHGIKTTMNFLALMNKPVDFDELFIMSGKRGTHNKRSGDWFGIKRVVFIEEIHNILVLGQKNTSRIWNYLNSTKKKKKKSEPRSFVENVDSSHRII